MMIKIEIINEESFHAVMELRVFRDDELTSATTKALDYLKQKQDKEMVV